jgi:hypothetical protein
VVALVSHSLDRHIALAYLQFDGAEAGGGHDRVRVPGRRSGRDLPDLGVESVLGCSS